MTDTKQVGVREWVALTTFTDEDAGMFYETGGVYAHKPKSKAIEGSRELVPGEFLASCPRCGQRFATVEEGTAEENRNLHFDGDADIPSVCRYMPSRRHLRAVKGGAA